MKIHSRLVDTRISVELDVILTLPEDSDGLGPRKETGNLLQLESPTREHDRLNRTKRLCMAPPPNAFSNDLGTWIFDEFMESIVFVNLKPKDQDEVLELWDRLDPIPKRDKARQTERLKDSEEGLCSTGFIMKEDDEWIWILTCAHVLGPVFNAREPITAENADLLFDAHVLCDHREMRYKRRQDPQRVYVNAQLVQINCAMDLMLLIVSREAFVGYCDQTHLALSIAPVTPPPLQKVAMLSWPSNRHRTAVIGKACHPGRIMRSMSASNPFGYRMRISEVDITSEHGSSGAPLLNGAGEYAGVLHGGFGSGFSYFICLVDLRTVLTEWDGSDGVHQSDKMTLSAAIHLSAMLFSCSRSHSLQH